jgi:hypothetical protein
MSERRDDTTERDQSSPVKDESSPVNSERQPGSSYYDDDATGYEVYDPAKEDEAEGDDGEREMPKR